MISNLHKTIILVISLLTTSTPVFSQAKLIHGDSMICNAFVDKFDPHPKREEIGTYEEYPELTFPKPIDLNAFVKAKLSKVDSMDIILYFKIDVDGQIECICLGRGNLQDDTLRELKDLIIEEFKFIPANKRGTPISSTYIARIHW